MKSWFDSFTQCQTFATVATGLILVLDSARFPSLSALLFLTRADCAVALRSYCHVRMGILRTEKGAVGIALI